MIGSIILLALASWHLTHVIGGKATAEFLIAGLIIDWCLEDLSVHTGLIFGKYYFNPVMGPKIDVIPIAIPVGWVFMTYVCWFVTSLILDHTPLPKSLNHLSIWITSAIGALIMSTIDISGDPFAAANHMWVWIDKGPYFGVPVHNYIGWFIVGFVSYLAHEYLLKKDNIDLNANFKTAKSKMLTLLPLLVYGVMALGYTFLNLHGILGLASFYAMGIPFFIALYHWFKWYKAGKEVHVKLQN